MDTQTTTGQLVARLKSWLASDMPRRFEIAKQAGLDEKTLRLSASPTWDPKASTIMKLEAIMPRRKRRAST
jgi:hypothetical protein